jgi:hypothetical protein
MISDILHAAGLSSNSGHYDGRPVTLGDITAKNLFAVSQGIVKNLGEQKQGIFNAMVLDLPTLKPSFFIEFLLRLHEDENHKWWWDKKVWLKHYSAFYNKDLLNMPVCKTTERIKDEFRELIGPPWTII